MVTTLNDIAPDNNPQSRRSQGPQQPRMGTVRHDDHRQGEGENQQEGMMGQISIFDTLNQKLLDGGFPRWNAGPYVVEPIVSVGFILAGLLAGIRGIIFAGVLFIVCKYSVGEGLGRWWTSLGGGGTGGGRTVGGPGVGGGRRILRPR
ncbi:protein FAM241B-like [Anneissia japonica]|uniref:protein FAM241B-like n=1 Tax=Anneissia japonica TaxID=1529436 RepID=UPI001425658C|nr:protein FAM241B-like [Anneissia japonica]